MLNEKNMENTSITKNEVKKLVKTVKKYQGQIIMIASLVEGNLDSYKAEVFNKVDVVITKNRACFKSTEDTEDVNDIGNAMEFTFDKIEDTYIDILDIFKDTEPEIHVMFNYLGKRYFIINLV